MEDQRPIIVKRIKKGGAGHHGGAWKVAFADFATAMMAFFLVLWLMATATPEQKLAIEGYFNDPVGFASGGTPTPIDLGGSPEVAIAENNPVGETMEVPPERIAELAEELDRQQLESLLHELQARIEESPRLREFKDQLKLDITDEGLRIQIVDKSQRPMFDIGQSHLKVYSEEILFELAGPISSVPNKISVSGHTDALPYSGREPAYSNWELSADRANAARRALVLGGLAPERMARVVGLASSVLFDQADPANPVNRRISIIVLNKRTELEMQAAEAQPADPKKVSPKLPSKLNKAIDRIEPVDPRELRW